jgi:hypothetical protein
MMTYRLEKGAPLSILEIDTNFRELEQRLNELEDHPITPVIGIEQQEDVLIFKVDGEVISHIVLPKFQPIFNGPWVKNTLYRVGCWAQHASKLYTCKVPHTSGETFEPSFWVLILDNEALEKGAFDA